MRRFFLTALTLISLALPALTQAKHPFTFEDMMKLKRVGDPQVSPDGKWVIFSVVDVSLEANTKTPHVWIVPLNANQESGSEKSVNQEKSGVPHVSPNLRDVGVTERELIPDQDGDRPRWSPNGKRFAFMSTKEGGSQVWIADFDSGAGKVTGSHQLTSIATEAGGELWSPDGKNILFTSDVYPECDGAPVEETACNAKTLEAAEKSRVKALIFARLLYRHWNAYKEGKRTHLLVVQPCAWVVPPPVDSLAGFHPASAAAGTIPEQPCPTAKTPRDLTPGDYDAPVFSLGGQDDYAFSPDGQEICYTSNHDKNPAASTNNDLWIVPIAGGAAKNITADNPASDSSPLYSPDGRYIAYRAQQRPGYESDRFRLMVYDRKTGEKSSLTDASDFADNFDHWVGTFAFAPDSWRIYFVAEEQGGAPLYWIDLGVPVTSWGPGDKDITTGKIQIHKVDQGFDDDVAPTNDGRALFFTRMSLGAPTEIYRAYDACYETNSKSDCWRSGPLTHFNDALLSQITMSPLESFWFTGAHNDKVQGFLVRPPNFDPSKKYPVKFLIHGGPQGAWGDDWSYRWNAELFAAPTAATPGGYVVIMINFHGSTGYGQKFIDAINGDWGGAPFEDLMKGLDYAEEHYAFIDKDRECALGASYGGYMANWVLGHTDRFKCIVTHDGMFNAESAWGTTEELWFNNWEFKGTPYDNRASYQKWSPHQYAKNFKTPTLVIHGQRDYRLDVSEGLQLFTTLQMEGVPSKMLYFPDEGHWVLKPQNSQLWYKTVNDWVDQWTKDQGTKK